MKISGTDLGQQLAKLWVKAGAKVTKENTHMRLAIPPGKRLAFTPRSLATVVYRYPYIYLQVDFTKAWVGFIYPN